MPVRILAGPLLLLCCCAAARLVLSAGKRGPECWLRETAVGGVGTGDRVVKSVNEFVHMFPTFLDRSEYKI
jgi:hypothetical protein